VKFLGTKVPCTLGWAYTEGTLWACVCVGVLVICVLVFTVFCTVCTVFLYCFVYVYLLLFVLSVLV